jgi:hypothetical protein
MTSARVTVLASLVAALALAPAADAAQSIHIGVPAPGHISLNVVKVTVKGKHRGMPKRLKLRPQKLKALPSSVRVMYVRRTIHRKRSTTYWLTLLTVNVATPAATSAQTPVQINDGLTFLIFLGSPDAAAKYQHREEVAPPATIDQWGANNADRFNPGELTALMSGLRATVDYDGDGKPDEDLDTGHYDDGHAFGWNIKSKADEKKTWGELVKESVDEYIAQLEDSFRYDVDGDGTIEKAPSGGGGGGQQIDTQVGGPVITGRGAPQRRNLEPSLGSAVPAR